MEPDLVAKHPSFVEISAPSLEPISAKVRVIYGDTDKMGIVYYGTYCRYLEQGRVEFMRTHRIVYADMERLGLGLPVTDLAIRYLQPAKFDDIVSIRVALSWLSVARMHFSYQLSVEPGDRSQLDEALTLVTAETRHGCVDFKDNRATRIPSSIYDMLQAKAQNHT